MTQTVDYDIVGSFNNQRISEIDAERSVNLFEYVDSFGKKPKSLINTSGLINTNLVFPGATGGARGEFVFKNNHYIIFGKNIYRITPANIVSLIGTLINTSTGYVGIDANTHQIIFVDGVDGYIWDDTTSTFTKITDPKFPPKPIDVTFLDGFFVVAHGDTNLFQLSKFDDGLIWDPLQQGAINSHPGNIIGCRTLHRRLFLFSANYTEVWENAGAGINLPFRRNNSLLIEYGLAAIGSVAVGFDIMVFLSQDEDGQGAVMEVSGTQVAPISTRALDFILAQYAADQMISDCRGFLIKENGLIFYRMNFTQENHTYVYNITLSNPQSDETKLWHEEEVLNGNRHPAQTHGYFNGSNYVGHYSSPILYQVDPNTFTNDGESIRRMRITKAVTPPGYQRIRVDRLQVDLLQGGFTISGTGAQDIDLLTEAAITLTTETAVDIILNQLTTTIVDTSTQFLYMSISKDGGQSYGYVQKAPLGTIGARTFRTLFRKLGVIPRGQGFVAKFEFYDSVPFIILGASWAIEVMPE